ncbi:hypothetical protein BDN70DRAFT_103118 [Pholiota conissans]|uniref:Uncharacterized protein n=1 Tax=Pholiota conissans TaxID=109636 RepID=A0A9P6CYP9_9AGAR|nr:hypothetical protein BDN70DRAFT_103118 [Pholiota conissans]
MQQAHSQPHPALSRSISHATSSQGSVIPPRHMNRMKAPPDGQSELPLRYRRQSQPVHSNSSAFSPQLLNLQPDFNPEPRADSHLDLAFSRRQSQTYQQALLPNPHPLVIPESTSQSPPNTVHQPSHDFRKEFENIPNVSRRTSQSSTFTLVNPIPQARSTQSSELSEQFRIEEPENTSDQHPNEAMSFNIGMAMLQPEGSQESSEISIATPRIFLPPGTLDQENDFDPYDPVHLNNEHSRTPSLIALYTPSSHSSHSHESILSRDPSRIPSPDHSITVGHPDLRKDPLATETIEPRKGTALSTERSGVDPPPYALLAVDDPNAALTDDHVPLPPNSSHFRSPAQTSTSSRTTSPERPPSRNSRKSTVSKRSTLSVPSESSHRSRRESTIQRPNPGPQPVPMPPPALMQNAHVPNQKHRHTSDTPVQSQSRPLSMFNSDNFAQTSGSANHLQHNVPPAPQNTTPPPTLSRDHLVSPPPSNYAKSTHPSLSTYSSNQARNPVNRHLPKRLVMPAPLNNNMNTPSSYNGSSLSGYTPPPPVRLNPLPQSYASPRQIPPRQVQAVFQPQPQVYHHHSSPSKPHPPQMPQAQEIHTAAVRKLKKRASVMPPASAVHIPQAPIISTVSFAPPVIGYGQNAAVDKALSRTKAEKIPKRVLSKRRTDL